MCVCTKSMTTAATARGHRAKEMRQQNTQMIKRKRTHWAYKERRSSDSKQSLSAHESQRMQKKAGKQMKW